MNSRILFLVVSVILVITLGWFAIYYLQSSSAISFQESRITSLSGQKTALEAQLTAANSQIASLQGQLNSANTQITALRAQVSAGSGQISTLQTQAQQAKAQAASLQTQLQQANDQILVLRSQVSSIQSQLQQSSAQVTTLQGQASSLQSQLDTANATVSSLQSQVASLQAIINLSVSANVTSLATVNATSPYPAPATPVVSFNAAYAGYIVVWGNSTSASGYITVTNSFSGYPYNSSQYTFGTTMTTWLIPVLPGTVVISYGISSGGPATATVSVLYYY